ncbi:hypothetical protein OVW20_29380, partial [Klebsiella pneumoniae]|uniref:hypothetical protein n=1 Tax=Klebsiella pneumoniae TaxID=573 RepID=UPI00226F6457
MALTTLAGCGALCRTKVSHLRPAPAHWVEKPFWHAFAPMPELFQFDALSFSTPNDGWIVGNRFLLHV